MSIKFVNDMTPLRGSASHPSYAQAGFIALGILYIIYLLYVFLWHIFQHYSETYARPSTRRPPAMVNVEGKEVLSSEPIPTAVDPLVAHQRTKKYFIYNRLEGMSESTLDAFLILFGSVVFSILAKTSSAKSNALMWVTFGVLVLWIILNAVPFQAGRSLQAVSMVAVAGLSLAMWSLVFAEAS